jgi:hypothetical protein
MQKLSGKGIDKFYKSCSVLHQESNKIGFAIFRVFFRISTDFLRFSTRALLFEIRFTQNSLEKKDSQHTLALHKTPLKRKTSCNVALGGGGGAAGRNSGEADEGSDGD